MIYDAFAVATGAFLQYCFHMLMRLSVLRLQQSGAGGRMLFFSCFQALRVVMFAAMSLYTLLVLQQAWVPYSFGVLFSACVTLRRSLKEY